GGFSMRLFPLLLFPILVFSLPPDGQSGGERPKAGDKPPGLALPQLEGDDDLAGAVGSINLALRDQYRNLAEKQGRGVDVAKAACLLACQLRELVQKDAALKK